MFFVVCLMLLQTPLFIVEMEKRMPWFFLFNLVYKPSNIFPENYPFLSSLICTGYKPNLSPFITTCWFTFLSNLNECPSFRNVMHGYCWMEVLLMHFLMLGVVNGRAFNTLLSWQFAQSILYFGMDYPPFGGIRWFSSFLTRFFLSMFVLLLWIVG